ncbi:helix-turn-helix transcriptional regulator [Corynebacterium afermentans subsp. lipophilum]|uniref:helix-turn-helix domain-containing protein n=1 Tax=Corynebacterium afermentans TaxID=38286 RepID=UPI00188A32F4|nr:helix-turn-helix transcriptional regulator [Corynebacterium afermentans]MBF4548237.1 helix-turn-helix transcriptional regulator [Corynebacterium afermentans subsp. lipophilum]WJY58250.1 anaerobic benzoate catabolism transcriptional regulator [Corynebacterium afermentans subsp. lipophilum]
MGEVLPQSHWASYALGLGERVRAIRLMRGLSQTRLAELAGVSRSLISNLERNDYNSKVADPTLSTCYRLASALQVPPAALLPGAAENVEGRFPMTDSQAPAPIRFQWPRSAQDTARFHDTYLRRGAPQDTPAF